MRCNNETLESSRTRARKLVAGRDQNTNCCENVAQTQDRDNDVKTYEVINKNSEVIMKQMKRVAIS